MKLRFTLLSVLLFSTPLFVVAQNVGIGTAAPAQRLEVTGTARVTDLAGIGDRFVFANPQGDLFTLPADPFPAWRIDGNAGTTPGMHFLGTTDAQDFEIHTDATRRIDVSATGLVGVNAVPNSQFHVNSELGINPIRVQRAGGTKFLIDPDGDIGMGANIASFYTLSVFDNATTSNPLFTTVLLNRNTGGDSYALVASGGNSLLTYIPGLDVGITSNGIEFGALSNANDPTGTGLAAQGNDLGTYANLLAGSGLAGAGSRFGVYGSANDARDAAGGYFDNGNGNFAYVGFTNAGGTDYKINGPGSVATIVETPEGEKVNMFCPEAPEILFEDYGQGQLVEGEAQIELDPIFTHNIHVDSEHPLRVFVQLEGDCNGVFVTDKTAKGFTVKELQNGNSDTPFTYKVVGNRKDVTRTLPDGTIRISRNQDVRFSPNQGPAERVLHEQSVAPLPVEQHERATR